MTYSKVYDHDNEDMRAESIEKLRELFPHGSTAYTVIRHVTRGNGSRSISVLAITDPATDYRGEARIIDVSHHVARVTGRRLDNTHGGVQVDGCGMDMCFALVYGMSRIIHDGTGYVRRDGGTDAGYAVSKQDI